jgi:inositol transport system substrate-binding protein
MKKIILWLVVGVLAISMAFLGIACKAATTAETTAAAVTTAAVTTAAATTAAETKGQIVVGVTYQNLVWEFPAKIQKAIQARAKELNVKLIEADGEGKPEKQIAQTENFITQNVNAIILEPTDREGCAPVVDKANAANIPIIGVNTQTSNVDKTTAYAGSDDVEAGRMVAQWIADQFNGKCDLAIIRGLNGHSAAMSRQEGIDEVLAKYPDIKVVLSQPGDWGREKALALMENWIQSGTKFDALICHNDEMAMGAITALKAAGKLSQVKIISIDAIPDALTALKNGDIAATLFQDATGQGKLALELAVKAANGEKFDKMNMIPFELVTKDNVDKYVNR